MQALEMKAATSRTDVSMNLARESFTSYTTPGVLAIFSRHAEMARTGYSRALKLATQGEDMKPKAKTQTLRRRVTPVKGHLDELDVAVQVNLSNSHASSIAERVVVPALRRTRRAKAIMCCAFGLAHPARLCPPCGR